MGLEAKAILMANRKRLAGKLHLDSRSLQFRSRQVKHDILLRDVTSATAKGLELHVSINHSNYVFEVPERPERWVDKILNPPSLAKKLGIKPGQNCWLSPGFSRSFAATIRDAGGKIKRSGESCDLAFYFIDDRAGLQPLVHTCQRLPDALSIWVVYPKGSADITQSDVMETMKRINFGPSKTASIDDATSSMRYRKKT